MHKIEREFFADQNDEFTNGNPNEGIKSTIVDATWLNSVQRELCNLLTESGVALNPNDDHQLFKLFHNRTNPGAWNKNVEYPGPVSGTTDWQDFFGEEKTVTLKPGAILDVTLSASYAGFNSDYSSEVWFSFVDVNWPDNRWTDKHYKLIKDVEYSSRFVIPNEGNTDLVLKVQVKFTSNPAPSTSLSPYKCRAAGTISRVF